LFKIETLKNKYQSFDAQIEYVKNEIEIRIESIKIELDALNECLKEELDNCKKELFE
jgi:hypothetical protein